MKVELGMSFQVGAPVAPDRSSSETRMHAEFNGKLIEDQRVPTAHRIVFASRASGGRLRQPCLEEVALPDAADASKEPLIALSLTKSLKNESAMPRVGCELLPGVLSPDWENIIAWVDRAPIRTL